MPINATPCCSQIIWLHVSPSVGICSIDTALIRPVSIIALMAGSDTLNAPSTALVVGLKCIARVALSGNCNCLEESWLMLSGLKDRLLPDASNSVFVNFLIFLVVVTWMASTFQTLALVKSLSSPRYSNLTSNDGIILN